MNYYEAEAERLVVRIDDSSMSVGDRYALQCDIAYALRAAHEAGDKAAEARCVVFDCQHCGVRMKVQPARKGLCYPFSTKTCTDARCSCRAEQTAAEAAAKRSDSPVSEVLADEARDGTEDEWKRLKKGPPC